MRRVKSSGDRETPMDVLSAMFRFSCSTMYRFVLSMFLTI